MKPQLKIIKDRGTFNWQLIIGNFKWMFIEVHTMRNPYKVLKSAILVLQRCQIKPTIVTEYLRTL